MVEKLASIGDDFFIQNDQGQRVFKVDGKALRLRDTLVFRDLQGNEVCKISNSESRGFETRWRSGADRPAGRNGQEGHDHTAGIASLLRSAMVPISRCRNILAHEYRIGNVATVSKKWFRVRDSYGGWCAGRKRRAHPGGDGLYRPDDE